MHIHTEAQIGFKNAQFALRWTDSAKGCPFLRATLISKSAWKRQNSDRQKKKGPLNTESLPANESRSGRKGPIAVSAAFHFCMQNKIDRQFHGEKALRTSSPWSGTDGANAASLDREPSFNRGSG
ncbi:hypothetical protein DESC_940082 [Desulfosarcina cetonica]|nr:hypothetical protein DESC_940082 [Desulfosarcina cetonica]